jgi:hypothetical protein
MCTAEELEQCKGLLAKSTALVEDYARVLEIRTEERDKLAALAMPVNVVQLTPTILMRERREGANSIIKVAMRRIRQTLGKNERLHQLLYELIDEDKGEVDSKRNVPA